MEQVIEALNIGLKLANEIGDQEDFKRIMSALHVVAPEPELDEVTQ